jgi:quercetin dioxygenase-like cupin family protein
MKKILMLGLTLALAGNAAADTTSTAKMAMPMADHAIVVAGGIQWGPPPASLQPGAKAAIIHGDPSKEGPFIIRLRMPDGYRVMPHWHPTAENVTVISGKFNLGTGDTFDDKKTTEMTAGSYAYLGPKMNHYVWAKGETEVQVHGMGPFQLTYVNPADQPVSTKK